MNYNEQKEIEDIASGLSLGENSVPSVCPRCNGGLSDDRSFTVCPSSDGILYVCYRASCKFKGIVRSGRTTIIEAPRADVKMREKQPNPYTEELVPLTLRQRLFFYQKYQLRSSAVEHFRYAPDTGRIAMPIEDHRGYRLGWQLRWYADVAMRGPLRGPKAITYWDVRSMPLMHFEWHTDDVSRFVLVEDILSAKRVAGYSNAIALLGTGLTDDSVSSLVEMGIQDIDVALDQDAWKVANNMRNKYSLFFRNFKVLTWSEDCNGEYNDPKDMSEGQLEEIFV